MMGSNEPVRLRIAAMRYGNYLTAGPDSLTLEFCYDSAQCSRASYVLTLASDDPAADTVPIALGDEVLVIDKSLHAALGAALIVLQVEMDLGELVTQYGPTSQAAC